MCASVLHPALSPTLACQETLSTTMEKNCSANKSQPRSTSAGPAVGESKPKTDGKSGSKVRFSRKRDPSQPKYEGSSGQARRSNPPRNRGFNKIPPQRGGSRPFYNSDNCGRREEVAETQRAEFSPAQHSGPKKINLNHLLNFTFEPRGQAGLQHGRNYHGGWGKRNKWGHKPFNKELFLQANCQFVVSEDQDYTVHFSDPDILVNWEFVEQVRIRSHEVPSCPICLYPPTAAKITLCGHIFCWACILHYLSLSDKCWSKCPICYDAVQKKDLKSVVALETHQYQVGDTITMQLMRRQKGILTALPKTKWITLDKPVHLGDEVHSQFSKLLLASKDQVLEQIIQMERAVLQRQYIEEKNTPEICFIEAALSELKAREDILYCSGTEEQEFSVPISVVEDLTLAGMDSGHKSEEAYRAKDVLEYSDAFEDEVVEQNFQCVDNSDVKLSDKVDSLTFDLETANLEGSNGIKETELLVIATGNIEFDHSAAPAKELNEKDTVGSGNREEATFYYFYQAEDGQHMFLHPVNVRCLVKEYGCLENCPEHITAEVVETEGYSMTEELRRRHRYLGHLPLTCEFSICELSLKPPVISEEILSTFSGDIEKRQRLRQRKAREEQRRERRIQIEENKKQGRYPAVHIALENLQQFPAFIPSDNYSLSSPSTSPDGCLLNSYSPACDTGAVYEYGLKPAVPLNSTGNSTAYARSLEEDSSFPSFAQMLKDGKARIDVWPKPVQKKLAENILVAPTRADSDAESDSSDRVPVPSFQNSFSQAMEAAFLQLKSCPSPEANTGENGKTKKKKKKQKLLFSTSVVHTK